MAEWSSYVFSLCWLSWSGTTFGLPWALMSETRQKYELNPSMRRIKLGHRHKCQVDGGHVTKDGLRNRRQYL